MSPALPLARPLSNTKSSAKPRPTRGPSSKGRPQMSKRGKKTDYPGIWEVLPGRLHRLLATASVNGERLFREKQVEGSLSEARRQQLDLEDSLAREVAIKQAAGTRDDTVAGFCQEYFEHLRTSDRKPSTVASYQEKVKTHVAPYFEGVRLKNIGSREVLAWLDWMSKEQGKTYARKTLHAAWCTFRAILNWSCLRAGIPIVTAGIRFDCKGLPETPKTSLTADELGRMLTCLDVIEEPRKSIIFILAHTGARHGEVSALVWDQIDLVAGTICFRRSQTRGVITETTKTKLVRTVPLRPDAIAWLKRLKDSGVGADGGLIFRTSEGTPVLAGNMRSAIQKLCKAADVHKAITPHSFRRAANDLFRQHGGDTVARGFLGHATSQMTVHYATVAPEEAAPAWKVLDLALDLATKGKQIPSE